MAQITSREELEEWLKDKPADWAQVIAARAALRALPYAFVDDDNDIWIKANAVTIFRAVAFPMIAHDFPGRDMFETINRAQGHLAATLAHSHASHSIGCALSALTTTMTMIAGKLQNIINFAVAAIDWEIQSLGDGGDRVWLIVSKDCNRLEGDSDPDTAVSRLRNYDFPEQLGFDRVSEWGSVSKRLYELDPTYQVWLNLYDRRILGEISAFDIPGDLDRTHDKTILARLADASDEGFWGKGATYVNTTLQRWIDEARIEARIEDILRKLRGGASAHYGAPEELAGRAALLDELDRLLGKSPQARHGIGGNHPPEPLDAPPQPTALPQEMREPLEAISTELEKREPDALVVAEKVKLLHRVGRKLEKMVDVASDEFAKSVGGELGKLVVKGLFWLAVINQILDWLAPLINILG